MICFEVSTVAIATVLFFPAIACAAGFSFYGWRELIRILRKRS